MPQAAHFNLVGSPVALNPEPFETLALLDFLASSQRVQCVWSACFF